MSWSKKKYFPQYLLGNGLQLLHLFFNPTLKDNVLKKKQKMIGNNVNDKQIMSTEKTFITFTIGGTRRPNLYYLYLSSQVASIARLI